MISVDSSYVRAVERSERYVKATVNINNVDYNDVGNLVYNSSIGSGSLSIGSTNASTVSFKFKRVVEVFRENQAVIPKLGIKLANGQYKYIKLGHFYIKDVKIDRNSKTTFVEAVDKMALLNSRFESRLLYPTNALNVIEEISNLIGVRFNNTNIQSVMISKPEGFTIREVLGFIGQILASFVVFNREGELEFRRLNRTAKRISKSHYFLNGLVLSDIDYRVNGIAVDLKNKDKSIVVAGEAIGNQIKLVNPIMTQSFLNTAFSKVRDIRFKPFSLKYQGDPALEVGDWVSVESYTGNFINVPVLSLKLEFNGGLKSTISADVKSSSSTSYEYKGTMERQIQFLNARIGADGSRIYSDITEPANPSEGDSWFKPNGAFTDLLIYENGEWVLKVSTGNAEELITKITKDEVLAPKLAAGIGRFIEVNADRLSAGSVTFEKLAGDVSSRIRDGLATRDDIARIEINNERIKQSITSEVTKQTGEPLARVIANLNSLRNSVKGFGRNYFLNTKNFSGEWYHGSNWSNETLDNNFAVKSRTGAWAGISQSIQSDTEEWWTYSVDVMGEGTNGVMIYALHGANSANVNVNQQYISITNSWQRFSFTFKVISAGIIRPRIEKTNNTGKVYIKKIKLEKGTLATPWSPAPEDVDKVLDSLPLLISTELTNRREELKGVGIDRLEEFYLVSPKSSGVTISTSGWSTSLPTMTSTNKYLWTYEKTHLTDGTIRSTSPVIIGTFGRDGRDGRDGTDGTRITRVTNYYKATSQSSGVRETDSGWTTTTQPLTSTNKYLWNYEHIEYSDNTFYKTDPHVVGVYGDKGEAGRDGVSVTRIEEFYLRSASNTGVTTSTSGWSSSISTPTETLKYLWKYERTHLSNGSTKETAPVILSTFAKDGKGILRIENFYLLNNFSTGVTTSTSGWSTSVKSTTSTNRYLWNYEKIYYTDGSHTTTLPVVIGTHGLQGATGPAGANGRNGADGNSVHIRYSNSTTGAGMTTSGAGKSYIGVRMAPATSVSSNPSDYTWTLIKGADGERGLPGRDGVNGKTSYLHIAYADDERGNGFSQNPTGKAYMGTYTDNVEIDSSDKSRYSWARIKGERGDRGLTGATGAKGDKGDRGEKGEDYEGSNLLPYPKFDKPFNTLYGTTHYITATNNSYITTGDNGFSVANSRESFRVSLALKTKSGSYTTFDYNNSHIVMNFRAKASTAVNLSTYMDNNSSVKENISVVNYWKWYSAVLSTGQSGIGSFINIVTDKGCTLEIDSVVVQNLGAMHKILESEKKIKVFESNIDKFTSEIGTVSSILSMNLDNLCTETDATKTGNDLYFNLKEPSIQNERYTVFADISNAPTGQEAGVYHSEEYQNDKRPIKNGLNTWVFTSTNASDTVNLYPLGANTTVKNVRVYKGDLSESSFATKEETSEIKSLIDQQKDKITLSVSEIEKIKTAINPGENLYVSQRGDNDKFFKTKVSMEANTYYTLVADLTGVSTEGNPSVRIYGIRPESKKQTIFNGINVFLVSYSANKTEINIDSIPNNVNFTNVQIYKGDYRVNFGDPTISSYQTKAEVSVSVKDGIKSLFTTRDGKVVGMTINGTGTKFDGGVIADDLYGKNIVGSTLTGQTKIKIGNHGFLQPVVQGLQINAPAGRDTNYGVGVQISGKQDGNVPKGMFIYADPDFTRSNSHHPTVDEKLLVVNGLVEFCGKFDRGVIRGIPILSNEYYGSSVKGLHRVAFLGYREGKGLYVNDGTGTNGAWYIRTDEALSDIRLKKNIEETTKKALEIIKKFKFRKFEWKPDNHGYIKPKTEIGLIAQEVQKIDDSLVFEGTNYLELDSFRLLNVALKSIQELSEENRKLKSEIKDIKEILKEIKNEIRGS